jgi:hypothetical protein
MPDIPSRRGSVGPDDALVTPEGCGPERGCFDGGRGRGPVA